MTQEEKIKELEKCIAMMDADNSALVVDLEHYKKVAAGLKGRNKQLSERINHYKELGLEGDKLYEKALAEIDEKNKVIKGLQSQVTELNIKLEKTKRERNELKITNTDLELALKYEQMPWWRKMFFKM